jgi:hypothetical protein
MSYFPRSVPTCGYHFFHLSLDEQWKKLLVGTKEVNWRWEINLVIIHAMTWRSRLQADQDPRLGLLRPPSRSLEITRVLISLRIRPWSRSLQFILRIDSLVAMTDPIITLISINPNLPNPTLRVIERHGVNKLF